MLCYKGCVSYQIKATQSPWSVHYCSNNFDIIWRFNPDEPAKIVVSFAAGKTLAIRYGCKYIETSPGINHNVDELLVGMLAQIELKEEAAEKGQLSRDDIKSCREMNDSDAISFNPSFLEAC